MAKLWTDLTFAPAKVEVERRHDGSIILRSPQPLAAVTRSVGDWLVHWAEQTPERIALAERIAPGGAATAGAATPGAATPGAAPPGAATAGAAKTGWRTVHYRDLLRRVRRIAGGLLARGLGPEKPLLILSDNGIDHALFALAAMHVGIPVAPISPAYSLMSSDFAKLRQVTAAVRPALVFANDRAKYGPALAAIGQKSPALDDFLEVTEFAFDSAVDDAFARVTPDTVAKILFTSGSTGSPKGVINTQRMLCASQQGLAQGWPFLDERPPIIVDWLPWSHTFGGNHNFNMILRNGGSLYIDGGKPVPGLIEKTVENLTEVSPTLYFNVPRGFDLLLGHLERDAALRASFFAKLDAVFYAAAALPQNLWERMEALAGREKSGKLAMLSAWGSTETSPLATQVHYPIERAGIVGLPIAGCEIKLVPAGAKQEVRVRGANVTPGYFRDDERTRAAFDEEGFYRIGDAMKFADDDAPERGLVFDGRVAEDFKLSTGTWVGVGAVRTRLIAACDPYVQDAVITGHDRDEIGALVFLSGTVTAEARSQAREAIARALGAMGREGTSSTVPRRVLILDQAASLDAGEITDKGYINQGAVLERRADKVLALYRGEPTDEVILPAAHAPASTRAG